MKKIISVLLLVAMVAMSALAFASCEAVTAASALEKADKALTENPYTVTMSMKFNSDNAELSAIFDAISMEIPVTVDGKNMAMDMSMDIMAGMSADLKMVVVENVLYYDMSVMGEAVKMKATLNEEQYKELMEDSNSQMPITSANFETLTLESKDGKQVISCSGISEEGIQSMNDMMADTLAATGGQVSVGDLSFTITINDGKYESMALTAAYAITLDGETVSVSMTMEADYAYENVSPITAPADADAYQEMSYDDLMG